MVADVRAALGRCGFACNEDDATELLLHFALDDAFTLAADTPGAAELCARTLVESLGLSDVAAFTDGAVCLQVASLLADNGLRTPTVEVCPPGRASVAAFGHRTVRVADREDEPTAAARPVVAVPAHKPYAGQVSAAAPLKPVSLKSLRALYEESSSLMPKGEEWLAGLAQAMAEAGAPLSDTELRGMHRFVAAASARLRGGFLAAADAAVVAWAVPAARAKEADPEALKPFMQSLPRSLAALGIR